MMNNELSDDQKERIEQFQKEYRDVVARTQIALKPRISPDGPIQDYADLRQYQTEEQQDTGGIGGARE